MPKEYSKFHSKYKPEIACRVDYEHGKRDFTARAYSNPVSDNYEILSGPTLKDLMLQAKEDIDRWGKKYEDVSIYGEWNPTLLDEEEAEIFATPLGQMEVVQ